MNSLLPTGVDCEAAITMQRRPMFGRLSDSTIYEVVGAFIVPKASHQFSSIRPTLLRPTTHVSDGTRGAMTTSSLQWRTWPPILCMLTLVQTYELTALACRSKYFEVKSYKEIVYAMIPFSREAGRFLFRTVRHPFWTRLNPVRT